MIGIGEDAIKVLIVDDCREGSPATGKTGVLLGDMPFMAVVHTNGESQSLPIGEFHKLNSKLEKKLIPMEDFNLEDDPRPVPDDSASDFEGIAGYLEAMKCWRKRNSHRLHCYSIMKSPCIELDDGGLIWGTECWWKTLPADSQD